MKGLFMFLKKECVAMLLAGGQGSRLTSLTQKIAKPAVEFGGKFRIIDFTLSNCVNSGFDTVGVLTQYQPLLLNEYIGNGQSWGLDRTYGGVKILPPYQAQQKAEWYRGTANAIYQNLEFISRYKPEYVLVLSGDHIYKMDYSKMLDYHKMMGADCTIAVSDVPLQEASRFGIMSTDEKGRIFKFSEKPKNPDSTKASMGIYIFNYDKLVEYLVADEGNKESSNDFGKNVIPAMLSAKEKMFAYPFESYWKDVGTIESLWEANMDMLGENPILDLNTPEWRIFTSNSVKGPQYVGNTAKIENSVITEGCEIYGMVRNSIIGSSVVVLHGAIVEDSVVMSGAVIGKSAQVRNSIIDSYVSIEDGAKVGTSRVLSDSITVIGADTVVTSGSVLLTI
jgi:glucose-1-phosphate adenylyltransferase